MYSGEEDVSPAVEGVDFEGASVGGDCEWRILESHGPPRVASGELVRRLEDGAAVVVQLGDEVIECLSCVGDWL